MKGKKKQKSRSPSGDSADFSMSTVPIIPFPLLNIKYPGQEEYRRRSIGDEKADVNGRRV